MKRQFLKMSLLEKHVGLCRYLIRVMAVISSLVLSACTTINSYMPWHSDINLESVQLISEPGVNSNHAVTMDIVFINDSALAKQFENLPAADWFSQKKAYKAGYPTKMQLVSWALVPDFPKSINEFPDDYDDALIVVLFANFPEPDYSKINISQITNARVFLGSDGLTVEEIGGEFSISNIEENK
ncbi:hypothetical protein [Aliikangiella coralliicola]|uniref:Type VI secretion system lipoprotein TssJ n=1 Tax=Aliikangiella coralliicola TaxID=2592383 RepID=A0A545UCR7_9GAMM|nr:hypothetical protein [Aliikangiella coralliicola]TQV87262.1 hypothetical protein FLL46_12470 [Aliikangiella coralliicola]